MEKESVIEIEFLPVWDKWAVKIKEINADFFNEDSEDFNDEELGIAFYINPDSGIIGFFANFREDDEDGGEKHVYLNENEAIVLSLGDLEKLKKIISKTNEKNGIPKRWRAKRFDYYYYISSDGTITPREESGTSFDEKLYEFGNYFKTIAEAEKYRDRIKEILLNREMEEEW